MFAEVSEGLAYFNAAMAAVTTLGLAWIAYKTAKLQKSADSHGRKLSHVNEGVVEVRKLSNGLSERLADRAEGKGFAEGRLEERVNPQQPPPA